MIEKYFTDIDIIFFRDCALQPYAPPSKPLLTSVPKDIPTLRVRHLKILVRKIKQKIFFKYRYIYWYNNVT